MLPWDIWAFWPGWFWHCSSWIRCKGRRTISFAISEICHPLTQLWLGKAEKAHDVINLRLAKEWGRAQFKLQLITEAARGSEESDV